jgi:hypothetical protein
MPLSTALSARITNSLRERGRPGRRPTPGGRRSARPRFEVLEHRILLNSDMVTNTNDSGAGSLRATISSASSGDTIAFADGVTGTITLTSGALNISENLDIDGPGAGTLTISGNHSSTVFEVNKGMTANISGLAIANGSSSTGGGIDNQGALTVTNCTISGDQGSRGGAIYSDRNLTATNCKISGNSADDRGGGIYNYQYAKATLNNCTISGNSAKNGGGIYNYGNLTVTNCTISGNSAGAGGGVYNNNIGKLTVTNCTISGNSASRNGGAIANFFADLTVINCTISGNSADDGGGIYNKYELGLYLGSVAITDSTLSDNSGSGGGGGIYNTDYGNLTLTNCTISGNSAGDNGGGISNSSSPLTVTNCTISGNSALGGGGIADFGGAVTLGNTIVAENIAPSGADVDGGVTSLGDNLIGNSSGGSGFAPVDLLNVNPLLGPLQNNGGPIETMALLPGSPAIGAGSVALIPSGITTDERGTPRVVNGAVDIGAFEVQVYPVFSTADNGRGSLRSALTQANQFGGSVITFTFSGLIGLANTLPEISSDVQILGPDANNLTVSGNDANTVFVVKPGVTATVAGLTIADGSSSKGGGILNEGTLTVTNCTVAGNSASGGTGGGIENDGTLTVTDSALSGNAAADGGGIVNDGTLTITDSTFSGNSAANGGGIVNDGTLTITDSTFSGNSASVVGGGIYNDHALTISDCTLADNSASGAGGGIYQYEGTLTLANTIIATNTAPYGPDVLGHLASKGYNLIGNSSDGSGFTATDLLNLYPLLGPLQDNGGPTETMALLRGSPAIATGRVALLPPGITTDQRGSARIVNGTLDIGAFESGLLPSAPTASLGAIVKVPKINKKGRVDTGVALEFTIDYSTAMDRSTADRAVNYQVDQAVTRRVKNKRKTVLQPVKFTLLYSQPTNSVILTVAGKLTFAKGSEILVTASAPNGVCSTAGVLLEAGDTAFKIPVKAKGIRGIGARK